MEAAPSKKPRLDLNGDSSSSMAASKTTRVVLALCGSFSPITNSHMRLLELARDSLNQTGKYTVERGILSCVHDGYSKKGLISSHHRLSMCRLAIRTSDWIEVDPWEVEQKKWTETCKVLEYFQEQASKAPGHGDVQVKLLCGADLLESFATPNLWADEDIKKIIGEFGLVVISRHGFDAEKFVYESDKLFSFKKNIHICTEWIWNDVSSTKIRRSVNRGQSIKYLISDDVLDYIKAHCLYQDDESL